MEHRVDLEEGGILHIRVRGTLSPEDVTQIAARMREAFSGGDQRLVLMDQREAEPRFSREARKAIQREAPELVWDRGGLYGLTHFNRMISRVIVGLVGRSKETRFFDTEDEARAWLRAGMAPRDPP
ncbi:hypothetical protein PPSIR1_19339 [Plesiocystis pacifica SIR-1]|uniref:STAS/SEC14 domain-containing protein n=2 Tax=Plesiocystis pacifica TaxID=191768 RepID=A6G833_9BACT|nr:hypothetical protein PPSIR1_19339 [Plesiocystis pacifica SIR-1]